MMVRNIVWGGSALHIGVWRGVAYRAPSCAVSKHNYLEGVDMASAGVLARGSTTRDDLIQVSVSRKFDVLFDREPNGLTTCIVTAMAISMLLSRRLRPIRKFVIVCVSGKFVVSKGWPALPG